MLLINRFTSWKSWVALLLLLSLLAGACGPEPTPTAPPPTEVVLAPTDTPEPTDTPTPEPTDTPEPTPTPEPAPVFDAASLEAPQDLTSYRLSERTTWEGTRPDGTDLSEYTSDSGEIVLDPLAWHARLEGNEEEFALAMGLMGGEGGTMDIYLVEDSIYMPVFGSWVQTSLELAELGAGEELPFDPEELSDLSQTAAYTLCQWLEEAEYEGQETYNGVETNRFSFDETSFDPEALPPGMEIEDASGEVYIAADGDYVVHMEMMVQGANLSTSPSAEEPRLAEGTLEYLLDLSDLNEPIVVELPEEVLQATSLPDDIPVPEDGRQVMAADMLGMRMFVLASDSPSAEIADFYRSEMAGQGWTETSADEAEGAYSFEYSMEGRTVSLEIFTDVESGITLINVLPAGGGAGVELEPYTNEDMGIGGVIPAGWTEIDLGVFLRGETADDTAVVLAQAAATSAEELLELVTGQLGLEATPESVGQHEADGLTWTLYAVSLPDLEIEIDMALTEASGLALIVLLQSEPAEHDALYEAVFVPVVDALAPIAEPPVEVADAFMTALQEGDYATAYDLSAPSLQEEFGSVEDLEAWWMDVGVEPVAWIFLSRTMIEEGIQLLGTATLAGEQEASLEVVLFEVDGEWRVAGFHFE